MQRISAILCIAVVSLFPPFVLADEPQPSADQNSDPDGLVEFVCAAIRDAHTTVKSGEYVAHEEITYSRRDQSIGVERREIHCIFDRATDRVRHEVSLAGEVDWKIYTDEALKATRTSNTDAGRGIDEEQRRAIETFIAGPQRTRGGEPPIVVVKTPDASVSWVGGTTISISRPDAGFAAVKQPLDVFAAGLLTLSEVRHRFSFPEYVEFFHGRQENGELTVTRDGANYILGMKYSVGKSQITRRTTLDASRGFIATHTVDEPFNVVPQKALPAAILNLKWEQREGAWVPVLVEGFRDTQPPSEQYRLQIEWKGINIAVADAVFDYRHFGAAPGTTIADLRVDPQRPITVETVGQPTAAEVIAEAQRIKPNSRTPLLLAINGIVILGIVIALLIRAKRRSTAK